jgi:transaldolase
MASKLGQLREMTVVVADTGDIEAVRRLKPQDCTTNPTLLLKAVENAAYAHLVEEAVAWGRGKGGNPDAVAAAVCDRLAVSFGTELTKLVPGRVSTEVDADVSFDTRATVDKARAVIAAYEARGVTRDRVLIKIASTFEGIRAAETLQREHIDCNLTLLFSLAQAAACADAAVFLISPFVGRILDWHVKAGGGPYTAQTDPGVASVRAIYAYYRTHGIGTFVMGAFPQCRRDRGARRLRPPHHRAGAARCARGGSRATRTPARPDEPGRGARAAHPRREAVPLPPQSGRHGYGKTCGRDSAVREGPVRTATAGSQHPSACRRSVGGATVEGVRLKRLKNR